MTNTIQNDKEQGAIVNYLTKHYLPATANGNGTVTTVNEYVDRDGVFHSDYITLPATMRAVRDFLGY
jgi:hypothetical protein